MRLAKIAAAMVRMIGEPFAEESANDGPPCSCPSCKEAWRRNQIAAAGKTAAMERRRKIGLG